MARDLVAELTEASHRFDSHNYVTGIDVELLDRAIDEMKRLRRIARRADAVLDAISVDEEWDHLISNPRTTDAVSALARALEGNKP